MSKISIDLIWKLENGNMSPMSDIGFIKNFYVINFLILLFCIYNHP